MKKKKKLFTKNFSLANSNLIYQRIIEKLITEVFIFINMEIIFNNFTTIILILSLYAQKVLKEIKINFSSNIQMNRLLQGDVGSGKTIIIFMSILISIDNCFQSSFLYLLKY